MHSPILNELNTTFVPVSDLKRAVKWYSKLLGKEYDLEKVTPPIYNLPMNQHTGVLLDSGLEYVIPSPNPLFNFHAEDIDEAYRYVHDLGYEIVRDMEKYDDIAFFNIKDPDGNIVMVCNG
ncbi:VOC family protein [Halobacillus litoralis]|uniref:Glyoxalase/bleomycin resistance/dioxygenase family protein n=1 Tax=Halobacillus litoralis TaxID=45668 RepID=A0A410MI19_9BACI|nr:VOC family protein [Halobacillus litoralis]QAS54351.1 glyoxalase/bleomycin resistance/dioxygenase family protein [Halobacillus litoralis]